MTIKIDIKDLALSQQNINELIAILGCEKDNFEETLRPFFIAASKEYALMFLGENAYSRGSDIREFRLYLLLSQMFESDLPLENQVSKLFQTTPGESKALIRKVMAKYQYKIKKQITEILINIVKEADKERGAKGYGLIKIKSPNIIEKLNEILKSIDGTLPEIIKHEGAVEAYEIKDESIERLKIHFSESNPETKWES